MIDPVPQPNSLIRETDDDARALGKSLLANAGFASLATIEPESGDPLASRIAFGLDPDAQPVSLMSTLAFHTRALLAQPRCSLLVGEPGKGDPLAHPRMSLQATAQPIDRTSATHAAIREHYLQQHPKAALYVDFGDFLFVRFNIRTAYLNGGFGKAYILGPADLGQDGGIG